MLKNKPKVQKKLAKLVLAALLCTGGVHSFISPSVAHAEIAPAEVPGTVTKDNVTKDITSTSYYYFSSGNGSYTYELSERDSDQALAALAAESPIQGYNVTLDNLLGGSFAGAKNWSMEQNNTVRDNTVTFKDGSLYRISGGEAGNINGGYFYAADVLDNTVNVDGGDVKIAVGGYSATGYDSDGLRPPGNVNGNTVNVNGGEVSAAVGGMLTDLTQNRSGGNANGNFVNVNGGTVGNVVGGSTIPFSWYGYAYTLSDYDSGGTANDNTVTITGGTLGTTETYEDEDDNGNPVTVTEKIPGMVFGGLSLTEASGNTVTIKGGNIDGALIFGGMATPYDYDEAAASVNTAVKADNNTVNILAPVNPAALFGGVIGISESGHTYGSGNTLNVAAKDVTTYVVGGFDNMNFYLPSNIANGDTMLTVKSPTYDELVASGVYYSIELFGPAKYDLENYDVDEETGIITGVKPTNLKGVTFGVAALKGVNLKKGDKVTLIKDENGLTTDSELKTTSSKELGKAKFLQQNNMTTEEKYELSIKKEGKNSIVTTVDDIIENETDPDARKSPVETRIGVMNMINNAGDMLAGQGLNSAAAAAADESSGGISFAISGSDLRGESGSHVDTKGISMNLGFAKEVENKSGKLLFAPFIEYGHGSYDSYQDNGMSADGKANYWGLGIMARQTNNNGFYYEGSIRGGRAKSDYGSDSIVKGSHISYDSSATYFAAHLGAGKVMDIGHDNTLDYYGKYFYSHTGSDSATIYRDGAEFDEINFSGVNSSRIRLGARITHAINEQNKIYGGLAYQYEFSGEARATYRQGEAPSPSMKGSSGLIELGWQVKPGKKSPMTIDVGVAGWVGKQRGVAANVQANWTF